MATLHRSILYALSLAVPLAPVLATPVLSQDLLSFGVISGQSLTNTGPTTIYGNIAVSPGTSYTGSGSVTQTGATFIGDAVANRIQSDLTTLYNVLAGRPTTSDLTGQDLGGMTLSAGVYSFDTSAGLAAGQILTLDGGGDPDAIFIFNIGTTLTANSGSSIVLQNGAQGGNVFFRVGSSATLDTTADMVGQIVALTSITLNTAATLGCGAVYARNGSVTLDTNTIGVCVLDGRTFDIETDDVELTSTELTVATALTDYVADGGVLPLGFAILAATQTPEELAISLSQLSGRVSTGVSPMVMHATDSFIDTVLESGRGEGTATPPPRQAPRDQGVPIGLVRDKVNAPYSGKYSPAAGPALAYGDPVVPQSQWGVWASGYGSRLTIDGDASQGLPDLSTSDRGFAAGVTYAPRDGLSAGVALSKNKANFDLGDDAGSGSSDTLFLALHGRSSSSRGYVEGALAFGRSDITTERTLTIGGIDRLVGSTRGDILAAHVEAGYRMGRLTPFAGLRAKSVRTDTYSETAATGTSTYGLRYEENTATSVRSELGVALEWPTVVGTGGPSFGLRASWAHEFASNDPKIRSFLSVPDVTIPITGTTPDRDSLILAATMRLAGRKGFHVNGTIGAEFSSHSRDVSGSLLAGYRW